MTPNFEDFSCKMTFGNVPPKPSEDEALKQPCLVECSAGLAKADNLKVKASANTTAESACHKLASCPLEQTS
ncbi:MAG: hypothetical protein AAFY72_06025, partial [Cyanobacteria bacterium J06649_4]